jgi:prolyl-tRNA editing enzyme YbaK/EbsC (Cys-tRNA(Pro) deacylase)
MSAESAPLSASATRVQAALEAAGLETRVVEHAATARTSADAAALLGCEIAQIAKSLVFRRGADGDGAVLVIASGANRVDEAKVAAILGEPVGRADAAFVRAATGYAIGGIPPLAHATAMPVLVDRDLTRFDRVYAAGGTPNALFPITPDDLVRASGGRVAEIAERSRPADVAPVRSEAR